MSQLRALILTCSLFLSAMNAMARQDISLKEVVRLDLSEIHGGFFSHGLKKTEVVREKSGWKSYQWTDSITKIFVKDVSKNELVHLLKIVNAKDTSIKFKQFNLRHREMLPVLHKLFRTGFLKDDEITESQQKILISALRNKKRNEQLLRKLLIPDMMDDRSHYKIEIITKSGNNKLITALNFATTYNLPWNIDGKVINNPYLSRIYASLTGNNKFESQSKEFLYSRMMMRIYWSDFRTQFCWANLQAQYPTAVSRLGTTLRLEHCSKMVYGWGTSFFSSLLPGHLTIAGKFKQPDVVLPQMKQLEDKLANLRKTKCYFFKYLQSDTSLRAWVSVDHLDEESDSFLLAEVRRKYKKLDLVQLNQVRFISVTSTSAEPGTWADVWLLLPDDTLIALPYRRPDKKQNNTGYVYSGDGQLIETLPDINLPF